MNTPIGDPNTFTWGGQTTYVPLGPNPYIPQTPLTKWEKSNSPYDSNGKIISLTKLEHKKTVMEEPKRFLITGGAGFIGSNLAKHLLELNPRNDVVILDNFHTGKEENLKDLSVTAIKYDLTSSKSIRETIAACMHDEEFDAVFHLAAVARIQPSFADPVKTCEINSTGTMKVLEYVNSFENRPKMIYAGSSSFYHGVYANPYTYSKWLGEEHCRMFTKLFNTKTAIARFFNVYGPNQIEEGPYASIIGVFDRQKRNNEPLTITGDGEKRRDFTHVADVVDGLVKIALSDDVCVWNGKDVFNFGTHKNYSINEVARMYDHIIRYVPERPGEANETLADYKRATDVLGWLPQHNLEDWIKGK